MRNTISHLLTLNKLLISTKYVQSSFEFGGLNDYGPSLRDHSSQS